MWVLVLGTARSTQHRWLSKEEVNGTGKQEVPVWWLTACLDTKRWILGEHWLWQITTHWPDLEYRCCRARGCFLVLLLHYKNIAPILTFLWTNRKLQESRVLCLFCGLASKLHFIFASEVKKPAEDMMCNSIFHLAKAITDAQRGAVTYSKRQNIFVLSDVCFPEGAICLWHSTGSFSDPAGGSWSLFPTIVSKIF